VTGRIIGEGLAKRSRCSRTSIQRRHARLHGCHGAEAAMRGPIAAVREGDEISIDIANRKLDLHVPAEEIERRLADFETPAPRYTVGVFAKYMASVTSAGVGAVTVAQL
jgi:dihydroxy-acid dehydratase